MSDRMSDQPSSKRSEDESQHEFALDEFIFRKSKGISPVWIIPIVAIAIIAWLAWGEYGEDEVSITIEFTTGAGIEVDKTRLIYKGIPLGRVVDMQAKDDLSGVIITALVKPEAKKLLTTASAFWLVSPKISLSGVSGIETLLSGAYIGLAASYDGEPQTDFIALDGPPPVSLAEPGLHLTLQAEELGSVSVGSKIYFRRLAVGEVQSFGLNPEGNKVNVRILVDSAYAHLISDSTRFWHASGLSIKGGLSGINVRAESIASLISGGIAFSTPNIDSNSPVVTNDTQFELHANYDLAKVGIMGVITFDNAKGLTEGVSKIVYEGITIGSVDKLTLSDDLSTVEARVLFDPAVENLLRENNRFWKVGPEISLKGISNIETAIFGRYIVMQPGDGSATRQWQGLNEQPQNQLGLRLTLMAPSLGSLDLGSGVYFKQVKIGEVINYGFNKEVDGVDITVVVRPDAVKYVNSSTRFWNASGLAVNASLPSGLTIQTQSLLSLLNGGIAIETPDKTARRVTNNAEFKLYENYDAANEKGQLITIYFSTPHGLKAGSELRYQGIKLGEVKEVKWVQDLARVEVSVLVFPEGSSVIRADSLFWVAKPNVGIVRSSNLDAVLFGEFIKVKPGLGAAASKFNGLDHAPNTSLEKITSGLNVVVRSKRIGTVVRGDPIYYRELEVGQVTGFELSSDAGSVHILVNIREPYTNLVRTNTVFWDVGGVSANFGWGGLKVQTRTFASMLDGGLSFITPSKPGAQVSSGQVFDLFKEEGDDWSNWVPGITVSEDSLGLFK